MMPYLLFFVILLLTNILPSSQNVGYIGPACAVVENYLFIHGTFVRKLEPQELVEFYKYEGALAVLRQLHEAVAAGSASVSPNSSLLQGPEVPQFCNGLDGTLEIVLNGCIVRKNHVYMAGRIIRPLTTSEKEKIDSLIHKSSGGNQQIWLEKLPQKMLEKLRVKRQIDDEAILNEIKESGSNSADPLHRPQNDIANLLGHFLHINASVAQRFIPPMDLPESSSPLVDRINESLVKEWGKEIAKTIRNNRRRNSHPNENFAQQNEQQKYSENHHIHLRGRRFLSVNPIENEPIGDSSMTSNSQYSHQPNPWMDQQHFPEQNVNYLHNLPSNLFQPNENQMHPSLSAFQSAVNPQYPPTYYNFPAPSIGQQPTFPSADGNINIKPGESVIVGGQTYVAVPMSSLGMAMPQSTQNGQSSQPIIGLMPAFKTEINLGSNSYQQSAEGIANFWPPQTEETINNYQGQNVQQSQHHFSSYPNNPTAAISSFQTQQMPQQFPSYPYYYHQSQPLNSPQPQQYYQQYLYGYGAGNNIANVAEGHHEDKKIEHSTAGIDELPNEICEIPSPF